LINEQRSTTQKCAGRPLLFYSLIFEIAHCLADNTVQYGVLTEFHKYGLVDFDEQLVRRLIEKITIFKRYMEFTFKDGEVIRVNK